MLWLFLIFLIIDTVLGYGSLPAPVHEAKEPSTDVGPPFKKTDFDNNPDTTNSDIDLKDNIANYNIPDEDLVIGGEVRFGWPRGIVPYTIDAAFNSNIRAFIGQAMKHIMDNSCVKFVARVPENMDYLHIFTGRNDGDWASDRYRENTGQHSVHIMDPSVLSTSLVIKLLVRSLGISEEHNRPDRDSYISIDFSQLSNSNYTRVYYKDIWDVDMSPPSKCTESSSDLSSCSSGMRTTNYGKPYDYNSITHNGINAGGNNVISRVDGSVASFGGTILSETDIYKLKHLYSCYDKSACGGFYTEDSGTIFGNVNEDECEWVIHVDHTHLIQIEFNFFKLDAGCDTDHLVLFDGNSDISFLKDKYCEDHKPTMMQSTSNALYLKLHKTFSGTDYGFVARYWRIDAHCSKHVNIMLMGYMMMHFKFGTFTATDEIINGRPVYRNYIDRKFYIAPLNLTKGITSPTPWVANIEGNGIHPGDNSGMLHFGGDVSCPAGFTITRYVDMTGTNLKTEQNVMIFTPESCDGFPPENPVGATNNHNGATINPVGTIIEYICPNQLKTYTICDHSIMWSPPVINCDNMTVIPTLPGEPTTMIPDPTTVSTEAPDVTYPDPEPPIIESGTKVTLNADSCFRIQSHKEFDGITNYPRLRYDIYYFKVKSDVICDTVMVDCSKDIFDVRRGDFLFFNGLYFTPRRLWGNIPPKFEMNHYGRTMIVFATNKYKTARGFRCEICAKNCTTGEGEAFSDDP